MREIHVFYGTQTGTTEMVASDIEDRLVAVSMPPASIRGLDEVEASDLAGLGIALIVCSTYGDGGMPDNAQAFYDALCADDAPDLTGLRFSVLAFGDSSYADFCAAGRKLDAQLEKLGAERIHSRTDCDIMYEEAAEAWTEGVIRTLADMQGFQSQQAAAESPAHGTPSRPVHIYFGTQTGTTEMVASDVEDALTEIGITPEKVAGLDEVTPADLTQPATVLIVCSTYGDGGMPDNAQTFYESLIAADTPRLDHVRYSVLAFGDSSYADYCAAGRKLDDRLSDLGAERLNDLAKCDVMYEAAAEAWIDSVVSALASTSSDGPAASVRPAAAAAGRKAPAWTRTNPYTATVVAARRLSRSGSAKEIMHYTLDLGEDGPRYEVGDALTIQPRNAPDLVAAWLQRTGLDGTQPLPGHDAPLEVLLHKTLEISVPSQKLVNFVERRAGDEELSRVVASGDREALAAWLRSKDALDLIGMLPHPHLDGHDLASLLPPLLPRSYSIASSPRLNPQYVDLTVSTVRYESGGRLHGGVTSTMLCDRIPVGGQVDVFVAPNNAFRVPADPTVPMIMVGPGTGIAPFRGFLQERKATGATGMNWLFFGDRSREHDFIYEDELQAYRASGHLHRLDLAFSRDQAHKIYVQDCMQAASRELYQAIEEGGHVYVCGDATRMAVDVDETLHDIVAKEGGLDHAGARDYVIALKRQKRYVRDVY